MQLPQDYPYRNAAGPQGIHIVAPSPASKLTRGPSTAPQGMAAQGLDAATPTPVTALCPREPATGCQCTQHTCDAHHTVHQQCLTQRV